MSQPYMPSPADKRAEAAINARLTRIQELCGNLCDSRRISLGAISEAAVDCFGLFSDDSIDGLRETKHAPRALPSAWIDEFSMQGRIPLLQWENGQILDHLRHSQNTVKHDIWEKEVVDNMINQARKGMLEGPYLVDATNELRQGLAAARLKGKRILVIGSITPWVEACCLEAGAEHITTLEYGALVSKDPRISTRTPSQFRQDFLSRQYEPYDAIVTFSSVEHSGLGRYGDALNPWGDVLALARASCVLKPSPDSKLIIGVPAWV